MIKPFYNILMLYKHYKATGDILRNVFKASLTLEQSRQIITDRMNNREKNFIDLLETTVFPFPQSPNRLLMEHAGYKLDDIKNLVAELGLEKTLEQLCSDGVYFDILEFKGKKDVVRGGRTFKFKEKDFSNPLLTQGFKTQSGGTRSSGTKMVVPLEYIREHNPYNIIASHEYDTLNNPSIIWLPILPAGEGLFFNLRFAAMGNPPVKWFSQVDEKYIKPLLVDKVKTKISTWMAAYYGKKMPGPQFVDMRKTQIIAKWMDANLKDSKGFTVVTYASSALRLIMTAKQLNLNIGKTVFWLMGEPLTEKIYKEITSYGCKAFSLYGCNELMLIGHGCGNPAYPDEMHICNDKLAVIQYDRNVEHSDTSVDAFLFSTILKTSPKILINTETGDFGKISKRDCGCGFEDLGFTWHMHEVRSFEKLTAEGATFIGSDLIPLIQDTLPSEIGGNATDYQFVEESDEDGIPKLYMNISPSIGAIDEDRICKLVFEALSTEDYNHAYSMSYWSQSKTLQIKRTNPIPTKRGKIVPLMIRQKKI
ncbi:MAG: hypothetical protein ABIJ59_13285 [Pseudomonadota bacterium]